MEDKPMSLLEHLDALRRVLIISLISILPGAVAGWYIREEILRVLVRPVKTMGYDLVFIGATEAFTAQLKIAVIAGLLIALPVIMYQVWKFVLPALHVHERRYIITFVPVSVLLFAGGILFAYYTVFNYAVRFLLSFGGDGLTPMLSLSKYLSFSIWFLLPFGVIFELPLVVVALARLGLVTPRFLATKRKWAFLAVFVIAAVVTPTTDMLTQAVMALAMYLLYEVSIWLSYLVRPKTGVGIAAGGPGLEDAGEEENSLGEAGGVSRTGLPEPEGKQEGDIEDIPDKKDNHLDDIYRSIVDRGSKEDQ